MTDDDDDDVIPLRARVAALIRERAQLPTVSEHIPAIFSMGDRDNRYLYGSPSVRRPVAT